jgi:hypothetical protein
MTSVDLRKQLHQLTLSKKENPDNFFRKMGTLKAKSTKTSYAIKDEELMAQVLVKAPKEYQSVLARERVRLGDQVTLRHMQNIMKEYWRATTCGEKSANNNCNGEVTLSSFNGKCRRCGKYGHKALECKQNKGIKGFQGNCNECGGKVHKASDCWEKQENASKRPPNWKSRKNNKRSKPRSGQGNEASAASNDANSLEIIVGSLDNEVPQKEVAMRVNETLTFPRTLELLKNPDFFIADTGATRHSTTNKDGMVNVREDQTVTNFGNGSTTRVRACGDLPIHIYNKAGQLVQRNITLGDVAVIPGGYSLFSITKLQQDGWVTYGDANGISMKKDGMTIAFDIPIRTEKGVVFAMYCRRTHNSTDNMACAQLERKQKVMSLKLAHEQMGHMNEEATRKVAK